MGLVDPVSNLLNPLHALLVVDFDVGLRACHTEAALVSGIVDRMVFLVAIEHMVLNLATRVESPANDGAVEAGTDQPLRSGRGVASRLPR